MTRKYQASWDDGTEAENAYVKALEGDESGLYKFLRHATTSEDMMQHWDLKFRCGGSPLLSDVKSHRHKYRHGPLLEGFFVVEWKNVAGKKGWILGEADEIAYEYYDDFYVFNRQELMNYTFMITDFSKKVTKFFDCVNCIYQRKDRKDQMTLIKISGLLESVPHEIFPKIK